MQFQSIIEKFDSDLWGYHFTIPTVVFQSLSARQNKRVVCTLNDRVQFQCALMPKRDDTYFINVNKKIRDQLKLKEGSQVNVHLQPDDSKYGLPMPEELKELMELDKEGDQVFHSLTPGKQRTLLYIIGQPKSSEKRIHRAIIIIDHIKEQSGKIDFKLLNQQLKEH